VKRGDLVYICPGDTTIGVFLGPDEDYSSYEPESDGTVNPLNRSQIFFDKAVYSVPAFQLEAINENR
jgi:hypothetical protein